MRSIDAPQVTNINCYVTQVGRICCSHFLACLSCAINKLFNSWQMLAASLGLKLFDVTRRILMYTKDSDLYKRTYAICRGTFPIHELCGTMTALLLARRDVLGVNLPQWQILGPAVFIHGMANFRGMKVSCSALSDFEGKFFSVIVQCITFWCCILSLRLYC